MERHVEEGGPTSTALPQRALETAAWGRGWGVNVTLRRPVGLAPGEQDMS